ncbi:hypothetical protein [Conexibacter sp. CPCC 206217]|nr:hypothetical protein [Conexibacter sp. CPCC 206217]MDO8210289.1 hypothetical protein [Conexibacter sp. CPCC 206217]
MLLAIGGAGLVSRRLMRRGEDEDGGGPAAVPKDGGRTFAEVSSD